MSVDSSALRIVYIAGAKNCGSTMLDAILGNAPGARSLGEVGGFHRFGSGEACACRQAPCAVCPVVASGIAAAGATARYAKLSPLPLKERRAHWILVGTRARREYARAADLIFDSTAAATGASVLIDSSKNASRAAALVQDSRHDVRVVHVVRDGRGYLRSRKRRAAAEGKRHLAPAAMVSWLSKNLLIGSVLRRRLADGQYFVCRYEDLVGNARTTLDRVCDFAGLDPTGLVDAATTGGGVERRHLYEPARKVDYRRVHLDPTRLDTQRETPARNAVYWLLGGFVSRRWGYDRAQSYLTPKVAAAAGDGSTS